MPDHDPKINEFLHSECADLRTHKENIITELRSLQRLALYATGGIWTWLSTHPINEGFRLVLWAPALLVLLLFLKALALMARYWAVNEYIKRVEDRSGMNQTLGWERQSRRVRDWIWRWSFMYYASLLIANCALAIFGDVARTAGPLTK